MCCLHKQLITGSTCIMHTNAGLSLCRRSQQLEPRCSARVLQLFLQLHGGSWLAAQSIIVFWQVVSSASTALGFLAMGDTGGAHLTQITAALVAVAGTKTESVMFAVGEALCLAFGGV